MKRHVFYINYPVAASGDTPSKFERDFGRHVPPAHRKVCNDVITPSFTRGQRTHQVNPELRRSSMAFRVELLRSSGLVGCSSHPEFHSGLSLCGTPSGVRGTLRHICRPFRAQFYSMCIPDPRRCLGLIYIALSALHTILSQKSLIINH